MVKKEKTVQKTKGRVYTENFIVCNILDMVGYNNKNMLKKNIIDNSCGDGAFLVEIVKRYCEESIKENIKIEEIKSDLEKYIYGIEIDKQECELCIINLNNIANNYNIKDVKWNIICGNTLEIDEFNNKMDYVVGNPPYVRVHNLDDLEKVKSFSFSKESMTDLYITFFEIGTNMLKKDGILGYITPSSYFTSKSGKIMREYFVKKNILTDIADFKHNQVFNASTYTCITILKNNNQNTYVKYYEYNLEKKQPFLIDLLTQKDFYISECFYFSTKENLKKLREILIYSPIFIEEEIEVKNGFSTLCDNFFIQDELLFEDYVIPVLKGSTGKWKKCLFPYENGKLIPLEKLEQNKNIKQYYSDNKEILKKRDIENKNFWWGFGRSQGINDVYKTKYAVNSLIKTVKDIKLIECKNGSGVYSGLYILTNKNYNEVKNVIVSEDFITYVSLLGKYKSGGYYTFSSKDIKKYLNYKLLRG